MQLSVIGIGPGDAAWLLPAAQQALAGADVVIGYHYYFQFVSHLLKPGCECLGRELSEEEARAQLAVESCAPGIHVAVISSGDAGVYAMASLVYEYAAKHQRDDIHLQTIPGISAFQAAAARLGAPIGHDFCCISLSDLMTPWSTIEQRITGAAMGDFVTSLYNPRSKQRSWQLSRLKDIYLQYRSGDTPVAIVRQVTREEESIHLTTLKELDVSLVDMFSLVMIGNSQTFRFRNFLITPRGYLARKPVTGEEIQEESFRQIRTLLKRDELSPADQWAVIRCIHSTADVEYEQLYYSTDNALEQWHHYLINGGTVITDVTMVQSGITRAFTQRYGVDVKCYLNDERVPALAAAENITRSQAGIRLAVEEHPDALFVVGNAPTALLELCDQCRQGACTPAGIIAAPVGFVNVLESKLKLRYGATSPVVIIEGRKGGSNVAAAIVNAAFTLDTITAVGIR
ncbi:MAG TPA: precorrin-3B C(17)-methyltransferase [Chitinophaga sp.]|uniref:precorrin-3B C(17)-methyltransferase n=1 Tax=Chitinophaga sp. TaxID=1869181 RepID=UPI002D08B4C9|nr:precorrin-3B C(17)-methyltransferase [Chitinophaga sp.]HVI45280.1 precorrin-3B C(17)-methyltransferase [Chitinophaga sp.]